MLTFWTKYAYWLSFGVFAGAIVAANWYIVSCKRVDKNILPI